MSDRHSCSSGNTGITFLLRAAAASSRAVLDFYAGSMVVLIHHLRQVDLEAHLFHFQHRFSVTSGVVDWVMA